MLKIKLCKYCILFAVLLTATTSTNAQNQEQNVLLEAVRKELNRTMEELKNETIPPYFLSFQVIERLNNQITARFGKIVSNTNDHSRNIDIDLRVGDYKFDNSHIIRGSSDYGFGGGYRMSLKLPLTNEEKSIRNIIWNSTDFAYKSAVESYEKALTNKAVKVAAEDTSADFSQEPQIVYSENLKERIYYNELSGIDIDKNTIFAIDTAKWTGICKRLSEKFVEHHWLINGEISFSTNLQNKFFINSEGSEIQYSETSARLMVNIKTKADDGMILPLYKSYFAFECAGLPSEESISKDIDGMLVLLEQLKNAPMAATATGPAILSGAAAGVFFHEIFGHRVEGFREKDPDASNTFKHAIGTKILPNFIDVVFNPEEKSYNGQDLAGYYVFDDEGVRGEKVVTVRNGVFERFLMSRNPIEGFSHSNGHGRKAQGRKAVTRQSNLFVIAKKTNTQAELRQMLIKEAKKQGKEYGLYFAQVSGGFTLISRYYPNSFNVTPLVVYKIFVDGRPDELVRGVDLIGTPLTTFSNVLAAGNDVGIFNGMCGAESGWVPVSALSPSLLVSRIEVQKKSKSQAKQPILKHPAEEASTK